MKLSSITPDLSQRTAREVGQPYSRHYGGQALPAAPPSSQLTVKSELQPQGRRRLGAGLLGLMLLGGVIWGGAEMLQQPPWVEAQEAQTETLAAPTSAKTPWQSASFPVEQFVAYTSPFGYRNHPYGGRRFHYGLDLAAPMGSYIRAWWEGTVVEVSDDTACGTSAVIESHGWLHIYCHMQGHVVIEMDGDRWLVDKAGGVEIRQGDRVKSGQRIGRVGMTGRTTGPHLHWGMKYQGSWVDPSVVLRTMAAAQ
ncbi:MAG: M23 family metallopeptidase [Leptolyngbyaceae cyanobacterium]